jgi:hypothetical protein
MLNYSRTNHTSISHATGKIRVGMSGLILFLALIPVQLFSQDRAKKEIQAYRLENSDEFMFDGRVT